MSSPFSSALARLDESLQNVHRQIDSLGAALEVNGDRLIQGLTEVRQQAAKLRDLIRAERPDAHWDSRNALGQLVQELELEIAAKARLRQQRRDKLLQLADELDGGTVKHRFDSRATALNSLRLEAIRELRTEATDADTPNDLPGPDASVWLSWVFGLQEPADAKTLAELRRNFPKLERFAGDMEESYWIPAPRAVQTAAADPPPMGPEPATAPAAAAQSDTEAAPDKEFTGEWANDEALMNVIAAAPHVKLCDNCGGTFPAQFRLCPFDGSALNVIAQPSPPVADGGPHTAAGRTRQAVAGRAATLATRPNPAPTATAESAARGDSNSAPPVTAPGQEPAEVEFKRLKSILQGNASSDGEFQLLDQAIPRKRMGLAFGVVAAAVLLSAVVPFLYHSRGFSVSKFRSTVLAAGADVAGIAPRAVPDSDIQRDIERKLALLKESSIQANVENGVVTLMGRTSSEWESLHAESLASQTSGVKRVKNEVQVAADDASAAGNKKPRSKTKK